MRRILIFPVLCLLFHSCTSEDPPIQLTDQAQDPVYQHWLRQKLKARHEIFDSVDCQYSLQDILPLWDQHSIPVEDVKPFQGNRAESHYCTWAYLTFHNPSPFVQKRVLYFFKAWQHLAAYLPENDSSYVKQEIGIDRAQEVLYIQIPAQDSLGLYIRYPDVKHAYGPTKHVWELTESEYLKFLGRAKLKFLLLGIILFPILFFFAQMLIQKDQLSVFYWVFLLGAALHMMSILETNPFFQMLPKLIMSVKTVMEFFLVSSFLTLAGLIKFIHVFLNVSNWSKRWFRLGNMLILLLALSCLATSISYDFMTEYEGNIMLSTIRYVLLLVILYILVISIWAAFRRVRYSRLLLFAFSPLVLTSLFYATYFILSRGGYSPQNAAALILISGFILTLIFFGIVLGVRNNDVRIEKERIEQQAERLREIDEFKSRFYTNITHEFRTPLTVIKGISSQIQDGKIKAMIRRNSERILNMVNQLLDLSKLETNSLKINWVNGDVISYLRYLTESFHSLAEQKQQRLRFHSEEAQLPMDFDEEKLQHILTNLLSNAIKFTPEKGAVKVHTERVLERGQGYLLLKVMDSGMGIPAEKRAYIFDRFYQIDDSTTRKAEGSGIGLALVKELVELLNGRIQVSNGADSGSVFSVYLPIHQNSSSKWGNWESVRGEENGNRNENENGNENENRDEQEEVLSDDSKPFVLLIEDNVDVTEYILSFLGNDYQTLTARNGKEGVEKAMEHIPDIIISDVMMPEMDGFEVCEQLKSDQKTSHIPIVLLTAKATQEDKITGLRFGADAYLTKPFDRDELMIRLDNLAKQRDRLQEWLTNKSDLDQAENLVQKREAIFLRELNQIIEHQLDRETFNTQALCREIGMSRTQLHRKLKALTGRATAQYIRTVRLEKARELLKTTDLSIGEIAIMVGFKDFSHFSRSFSKEFDITPSKLRN